MQKPLDCFSLAYYLTFGYDYSERFFENILSNSVTNAEECAKLL